MSDNVLYYGDNLDILRQYVKDETVGLIYLDPPFKSDQDYNVLFAEQDGMRSAAQIKAFEDTWRWDQASARAYKEVVENGPERVSKAMQAFRTMLGDNDLLAYLAMMAPRLVELHRVLKPTGSIYLHCDPTASHYLKMLLDGVFAAQNFANEIVWKRTHAHGGAKRFGPVHDILFFYHKSDQFIWNAQYVAYSESYKDRFFRFSDPDGQRYRLTILTGSGTRTGSSGKPWRGIDPTKIGRHWAVPGYVRGLLPDPNTATVQEALDQLDALGRIVWPKKKRGTSAFKQYLDDMKGALVQDVWVDIPPISAQAAERLGYPTQKPEALLERIINASSNEGDTVLDPFCGCGTAIAVAQRLNRRWIGIDITHLAINLVRYRLKTMFESEPTLQDRPEELLKYSVIGVPTDLAGARALAEQDRFQFQCWALGLVGARTAEAKRGADKGIDGWLVFHDDNGATKRVVLSVKSGKVSVRDVCDLRGVVEREQAALGVLITLQEPTDAMRSEAAGAGFYSSPWTGKDHPQLQILTIEQLLEGKQIDMPSPEQTSVTFKKAPKAKKKKTKPRNMLMF